MDLLPVHVGVLTIAADIGEGRSASAVIAERARAAGHAIVAEETVRDAEAAVRDQLVRWIADPNIDVVIVAAGVESESASAALAPLVMQTLPGYTDLFRWLTFQEIGASAMLSAAEAALCESTYVFVLPAHDAAVRAAMDRLILPQLDVRTRKNLVLQMPRLAQEAKRALQAVPMPVAAEKTEGGSGVLPKPPARARATTNTIARKASDPPTKPIDLAKLEKQIAMSGANDAPTKQVQLAATDAATKVVDMSAHQAKTRVVDMTGRMLPRVPPGADESAEDDGALAGKRPGPLAVAKVTAPAVVTIPPVAKAAAPVPRKQVITPVSPVSQLIATRDHAITPVKPLPVVPPPALASDSVEELDVEQLAEEVPPPTPEPARRARVLTPPPPPPRNQPDFDAVDAPLSAALTQPPVRPRKTTPPPIDPIAQVTAKPIGVVDLPQGDFVYPVKKSGGARLLKILAALAVLGAGFVAVVELYPRNTRATQIAVVEPAPAPVVAAPVDAPEVDALEAIAIDAGEAIEDIEVEPTPTPVASEPSRPAPVRTSTRPRPPVTKSPAEPAVVEAEPDAPEPADDPACDEVSCVLSKYDRPCCERFRPADTFKPATGSTPEELDKRLVKAAIEKIKPKVVACGEQAATKGTVKLAVTVQPDGSVKSVSVTEAPSAPLGECVAGAMRRAQFAKTVQGGEFVYPFVF